MTNIPQRILPGIRRSIKTKVPSCRDQTMKTIQATATTSPSYRKTTPGITLTGHSSGQARHLRHIVKDLKQKHRRRREFTQKERKAINQTTAGGEAKGSGPSSLGRYPRRTHHIPGIKGTNTVTRCEERTEGIAMKKREELKERDEQKNIATTEQMK